MAPECLLMVLKDSINFVLLHTYKYTYVKLKRAKRQKNQTRKNRGIVCARVAKYVEHQEESLIQATYRWNNIRCEVNKARTFCQFF